MPSEEIKIIYRLAMGKSHGQSKLGINPKAFQTLPKEISNNVLFQLRINI